MDWSSLMWFNIIATWKWSQSHALDGRKEQEKGRRIVSKVDRAAADWRWSSFQGQGESCPSPIFNRPMAYGPRKICDLFNLFHIPYSTCLQPPCFPMGLFNLDLLKGFQNKEQHSQGWSPKWFIFGGDSRNWLNKAHDIPILFKIKLHSNQMTIFDGL